MLDATLLPLRNDRAALRAMHPDDAAAYAEGTADPTVRRYAHLPEPEYTELSVTALIRGTISGGLERGDLAVLSIADPDTDAFAGSLVLFDFEGSSIEVGFWVHPAYRRNGMAAAAITLAVEFARRSGFTRLTARTVPENHASHRVLERAGFTAGEAVPDAAPSGDHVVLLHYVRDLDPVTLFPLDTLRLRLRLHEHADTPAFQRIYARPDVARYLLDEPWTLAGAARRLSERMAKVGVDDDRTALALAIEHQNMVVGDVQLWLTDVQHRTAEIGWVLDPDYGGRGLATEAVRAVLDLAFAQFGLHRVAAQMDARNHVSARLAQRVGMRQEAHLRQNWWNKGEWTDTFIYGALAGDLSDWSPQ